jgi:hypothetical protein
MPFLAGHLSVNLYTAAEFSQLHLHNLDTPVSFQQETKAASNVADQLYFREGFWCALYNLHMMTSSRSVVPADRPTRTNFHITNHQGMFDFQSHHWTPNGVYL